MPFFPDTPDGCSARVDYYEPSRLNNLPCSQLDNNDAMRDVLPARTLPARVWQEFVALLRTTRCRRAPACVIFGRRSAAKSRIAAVKATVREGQAPAVVVALEPGEKLTSEAGAMMFISGDVQMDVEMPGGLMGGLKRAALAGESLFLVNYVARGSGAVGICGPFPGSIREHELDGEIICEKHAYLGHVGEIAIESALAQRLGMGITGGGEGFFLQRLKGRGTVWLHGGGDFLDFDLADGQTLVVDTGCMVMVEPTVKYEVKMQSGIKKSLFGGEGLFLVHMTGPGHATLQTLPFARTARRVLEAAHRGGDERGGLLSNILGE